MSPQQQDVRESVPPLGEPDAAEREGLPGDRRDEHHSFIEHARSLGTWGLGLSYMVPTMLGFAAAYKALGSQKIDRATRLYIQGQLQLLFVKWRAEVHPDVDPNQQYIFCQNHINHFDHLSMYNSTPHFKQGVELQSHFKYPIYGWFMEARGTIPVPANKTARTEAIFEGMKAELEAGRSILAFPEGTRTLNGRVGAFRRGVFVTAQRLGVPIVPVAVTGMYDVMRKGSLVIRPGQEVTVHVEKPVPTAGRGPEEVTAIAAGDARRHHAARGRVPRPQGGRPWLTRASTDARCGPPASGSIVARRSSRARSRSFGRRVITAPTSATSSTRWGSRAARSTSTSRARTPSSSSCWTGCWPSCAGTSWG
jgi:1-acyl-sn-glycerol-3-phosphate acyltransferase